MTWCSVWRIHILWPVLGKLQFSFAVEIALAVAILGASATATSNRADRTFVLFAPFVLLGIMVVGLPVGLYPGKTLVFVTKDFGPTLVLFLAVATCLRSMDDVNAFAFAHLVGATVYCAWVYFTIPVGPEGRLGGLVFYDANDFAVVVASTIPFAIYFARPGTGLARRVLSCAALLLFVLMIVKSGSRGGFLGLLAETVFILVAFRAIPLRLRVGVVAAGSLLMLLAGSSWYWSQMATVLHPDEDYNSYEVIGRKAIWKRGVGYMLSRPLFGVGASNFPQAEGTISDVARRYASAGWGLKWSTAHNSFVLVGAELGVFGLIVFVAMFVSAFTVLMRIRVIPRGRAPPIDPEDVALARALVAALIAFCVGGSFVSAAYFAHLYVILGITAAHVSGLRVRARGARRTQGVAAITQPTPCAPPRAGTTWGPALAPPIHSRPRAGAVLPA